MWPEYWVWMSDTSDCVSNMICHHLQSHSRRERTQGQEMSSEDTVAELLWADHGLEVLHLWLCGVMCVLSLGTVFVWSLLLSDTVCVFPLFLSDSVSSVGSQSLGTEDVGEGIRHWLGVPRGGARRGSPYGSSTISNQSGRQSVTDTMSTYSFRWVVSSVWFSTVQLQ